MKKKWFKRISACKCKEPQNATVSTKCHKDTKACYNYCFPDRDSQKLPLLREPFPITLYSKPSSSFYCSVSRQDELGSLGKCMWLNPSLLLKAAAPPQLASLCSFSCCCLWPAYLCVWEGCTDTGHPPRAHTHTHTGNCRGATHRLEAWEDVSPCVPW